MPSSDGNTGGMHGQPGDARVAFQPALETNRLAFGIQGNSSNSAQTASLTFVPSANCAPIKPRHLPSCALSAVDFNATVSDPRFSPQLETNRLAFGIQGNSSDSAQTASLTFVPSANCAPIKPRHLPSCALSAVEPSRFALLRSASFNKHPFKRDCLRSATVQVLPELRFAPSRSMPSRSAPTKSTFVRSAKASSRDFSPLCQTGIHGGISAGFVSWCRSEFSALRMFLPAPRPGRGRSASKTAGGPLSSVSAKLRTQSSMYSTSQPESALQPVPWHPRAGRSFVRSCLGKRKQASQLVPCLGLTAFSNRDSVGCKQASPRAIEAPRARPVPYSLSGEAGLDNVQNRRNLH